MQRSVNNKHRRLDMFKYLLNFNLSTGNKTHVAIKLVYKYVFLNIHNREKVLFYINSLPLVSIAR